MISSRRGFWRAWMPILVISLPCCGAARAQSPRPLSMSEPSAAERLADRNLDVAKANPLALRALLLKMPKGADLHNHLSGAIYAETWIHDAIEDHLCVDLATHSFAKPEGVAVTASEEPNCAQGQVPAAQTQTNQELYDALIDAFSMRGFVPAPGVTGHDHFFATFGKFGGTDHKHFGELLDEVAARAAAQNEQYLELMHTPAFKNAAAAAGQVSWTEDFAQLREQLLAHRLRDDIPATREGLDQAEADRGRRERCAGADAAPACRVQIRFLYQVLRGLPKEIVFAQTVLGFETALVDPRFVGINYVMPEDGYVSMSDYALHMRMLAYLHTVYPAVHIALHAGELAPGLVPYEGLCCHIRLAVEEAHAERIGHGVDVMYENHPHELLKEMAAKHVMVEISLTSNDIILGISGKDHPFAVYWQFGVPVALATDDEGVSRIDLTHEYVRAAQTYGLHYSDLKQMVRTSLEHSFLPGESLWKAPDVFRGVAAACSREKLGAEKPSPACAAFLRSSERAQQQWELEKRLQQFESQF
jgi:adenosine deaminase